MLKALLELGTRRGEKQTGENADFVREMYAAADGVSPQIIRAAVTRDLAAMDERTRTAFEFAGTVVARDIRSEELRPLIELWWGTAGTVELALVIAATRVFPTAKRALAHGQACSRVVIGHETVRADLQSPQAA